MFLMKFGYCVLWFGYLSVVGSKGYSDLGVYIENVKCGMFEVIGIFE